MLSTLGLSEGLTQEKVDNKLQGNISMYTYIIIYYRM